MAVACGGGPSEEEEALAALEALFGDSAISVETREVRGANLGSAIDLVADGATVTFDDMFWVDSIELETSGDFVLTYTPDDRYLLVPFTIVNGSDSDIDPDDVHGAVGLEDGLGRQNSGVTLLGIEDHSERLWGVVISNIVRAGNTGRGIMAFDHDPRAPDLQLRSDRLGFTIDIPGP